MSCRPSEPSALCTSEYPIDESHTILEPIVQLQTLEFMTVFFQIDRCLYESWRLGIHRVDPSLANFMYTAFEGEKNGVLNDWDLSPPGTTYERAGTLPFLPLDLLGTSPMFHTRLYRHDLEAAIWVLTWIVICYDNGEPQIPSYLQLWLANERKTVVNGKSRFFCEYGKKPASSWKEAWPVVQMLFDSAFDERIERVCAHHDGRIVQEEDLEEVARHHWKIVESSLIQDDIKAVILASRPQF